MVKNAREEPSRHWSLMSWRCLQASVPSASDGALCQMWARERVKLTSKKHYSSPPPPPLTSKKPFVGGVHRVPCASGGYAHESSFLLKDFSFNEFDVVWGPFKNYDWVLEIGEKLY
ncbi:hypothetical protein RIF29_29378 [Crotalaria pallida]|uniref:Uncharacterized protein n=1 Tax=Crotalaria pallida TaxID=3830 RepID=A0AAN9EFF2_CROPI